MQDKQIQWYPGHMAKTKRMISESMKDVDAVAEIRDARIPRSSFNNDIEPIISVKPKLICLNKSDLASPEETARWCSRLSSEGVRCIAIDCSRGKGLDQVRPAIEEILSEKTEAWRAKGMSGRRLRVMTVGIPNVGKSTFINRMIGTGSAKAENRPGVTRDRQWYSTGYGLDLLDMPGILPPKIPDGFLAEDLAFTGTIRDDILDIESLAYDLCRRLYRTEKDKLVSRYSLSDSDFDGEGPFDFLGTIALKRNLMRRGGEPDTERCAKMIIDEFRSGKIGRITLEKAD